MWLGSGTAALLCILTCCAAQQQPSQTQLVPLPDGKQIVVNIYNNQTQTTSSQNNNNNYNANNPSATGQPTSAPTTPPYSAPPANTPPSPPPPPPPPPPSSGSSSGTHSCRLALPSASAQMKARPLDCWVSSAGGQNRCNIVEHTNYKGDAVRTVSGIKSAD